MEHDASEIESEIQSMFSQTIANASGYDGLTFHLMHCGAAAEHISPNQATAFEASWRDDSPHLNPWLYPVHTCCPKEHV